MNNRKATAARIITSKPVFEKVSTRFGVVKKRTNRFIHIIDTPVPKLDRKMTAREKEIRKIIKRNKSSDYRKRTHTASELGDLRIELHLIVAGLAPVPTKATA